jgi:hypothetical protein
MEKMKLFLMIVMFFVLICGYAEEVDEETLFDNDVIGETDSASGGEEPDSTPSDNSLFGEDIISEYDEEDLETGIDELLLKTDTMELGGTFEFSLSPVITWQNVDLSAGYVFDHITEPDIIYLDTILAATLFFDARPDEEFRVFGKTEITYPFTTDEERSMDEVISIRELFADINWKNILFFRAGKHMISWGVGYFFSPADILNITPIDPENPEIEREGPVSLKVHMPIDIHNLYLYIIANDITKPDEIALAPKAEFVIGNLETGLGGIYQKDLAPMGVLTLSFPFLDIDIFAEGVVSYGANKVFLQETDASVEHPSGLMVVEKDDEFFFSGTIGFMFSLTHINIEWEEVSFYGQYYYNGYGYDDPSLFRNQAGIGTLLVSGDISVQDILETGMHYMAASIIWTALFDTDFSFILFWIGNLSDGSGQVSPSIRWDILEYASIHLGISTVYGGQYDEFTCITGQRFSINLDVVLGKGSF